MKKNELLTNFYQPSRQSPLAILFIALKLVTRLARTFWPVILVMFIGGRDDRGNRIFAIVALVFSAFSAVFSLLSYFKFYFYIDGDSLIIEKGVLRKVKLEVPFDRIQTVNFRQNVLHQMFNVVELEIDTAGSKGSELTIEALDKSQADALRTFILSNKKQGVSAVDQELEQTVSADQVFKLSILDLVKIGVSQNHFRTAAVIVGFIFGLWENIENALGFSYDDIYDRIVGIDTGSFLFPFLISIPLFLFISFLITLGGTVLRHFNFTLFETVNGFKVQSGLFTRREQSAVHHKIQMIRWATNPVKKIFGLFSARLYQAASTTVGAKKSISFPGIYLPGLERVRQTYFPENMLSEASEHPVSPLIKWRYLLFYGIIPAIVVMAALWYRLHFQSFFILAWLPMVWFILTLYYRKRRFYSHPEFFGERSGIVGTDFGYLLAFKVQSVRINQNIYQAPKGACQSNPVYGFWPIVHSLSAFVSGSGSTRLHLVQSGK